jgi:hypothetical protein
LRFNVPFEQVTVIIFLTISHEHVLSDVALSRQDKTRPSVILGVGQRSENDPLYAHRWQQRQQVLGPGLMASLRPALRPNSAFTKAMSRKRKRAVV